MTQQPITEDAGNTSGRGSDTAEWIIAAASERHIAEGKTREEARKIVLDAFSGSSNFPSLDEL